VNRLLHPNLGDPFVLLDDNRSARANASWYLSEPVDIVTAWDAVDLPRAFKSIETGLAKGSYAAGYFAYELGYALHERLRGLGKPTHTPLLEVGLFRSCQAYGETDVEDLLDRLGADSGQFRDPTLNLRRSEYLEAIERIKDALGSGESYQVNFTLKVRLHHQGHPGATYRRLRRQQPVEFGAFLHLPELTVLSRSPELFVRRTGSVLHARPMKGTSARAHEPSIDAANAAFLRSDEKSRAENIMIVDLLRNDFARLCRPGTIAVPELLTVETYATLHQMTSTIRGEVTEAHAIPDLFDALFPSGSVTGAPKLRTMQLLAELERDARGVYTGAIGMFTPTGDFCLSVPIRTVVLASDGAAELGIGSGVVYDSDPVAEYEECILKARFLTDLIGRS